MFVRFSYEAPVPFSLKGVQRNHNAFIGSLVHYPTSMHAFLAAYEASSETSSSSHMTAIEKLSFWIITGI